MQIEVGDYLKTRSGGWFKITSVYQDGGTVEGVGRFICGRFEVYGSGHIVISVHDAAPTREATHHTPFEYHLLQCSANLT